MKAWYLSKTIWFNVVMTVIGAAALFQAVFTSPAAAGIVTQHTSLVTAFVSLLVQGIGNLILRIWFTTTAIGTSAT
jgi:hypothetical protein